MAKRLLGSLRWRYLVGLAMVLGPGNIARAQDVTASSAGGILFVADGAGNSYETTNSFRRVLEEEGVPVEVVRVAYSHGNCRAVADQTDYNHTRAEGRALACQVRAYHDENPGKPIYLAGHSVGAMVILATLEELPPAIVERAFLISPSMSTCYDVRPALLAVKGGLHSFSSRRDIFVLGFGTRLVGTADRQCTATAGRVGFQTYAAETAEDANLYAKFYQRSWTRADRSLGNNGGHYGSYQPEFLRSQVVPWMRVSGG